MVERRRLKRWVALLDARLTAKSYRLKEVMPLSLVSRVWAESYNDALGKDSMVGGYVDADRYAGIG